MVNPFTPGYAQRPPVLGGREVVLSAIDEAGAVVDEVRRTPNLIVMTGFRGVGKTVVLDEAADRLAGRYGWLAVHLEARADQRLVHQASSEIDRLADRWADGEPGRRPGMRLDETRVAARPAGFGVEATWRRASQPENPRADLYDALLHGAAEADARGTAIVLTVDEAQQLDKDDARALGAALQRITRDSLPVLSLLAGLPSLDQLTRMATGTTFLERADWHELTSLSPDQALGALTGPADDRGRPFERPAASLLVEASAGYPYAIQLYGSHAWRESEGRSTIGLHQAEQAVEAAQGDLERGLFRNRWEQSSPLERQYLAALARLHLATGAVTGGEVAAALGKSAGEVGYLRTRLLRKGTLVVSGRRLLFPVPSMAEYILRQASET